MKANIGDRIIIEGKHLGDSRRIGIITGVAHNDGSPPYDVRWLEDGYTSVVIPGAEARIEPAPGENPATSG
ncbi:DUF1918 domain-containing protein [Actinoplanes sp. NPDC020271]|uniref:DUF1918 domain-containing protein n=1 Tax=Actinoplanes sp. NPDC020271 TaxID=3363896 RepID=UPI0037A4C4CC